MSGTFQLHPSLHSLQCINCKSFITSTQITLNVCQNCKENFSWSDVGIVDFLPIISENSSKKGLTNRFFESNFGSELYSAWVTSKHALQKLLKVEDKIIGLGEVTLNKNVLDIGCGPNLNAYSVEYPHSTCKFYSGVDYSNSFVQSARRIHSANNMFFARASALALPFRDQSFDVVMALYTIHHVVGSPTMIVSELVRTTKETVIIFDHVKHQNKIKSAIQSIYWRIFDGGENYLTWEEWQRIFERSQLKIIKSEFSGLFFNHVFKVILQKESQNTPEKIKG